MTISHKTGWAALGAAALVLTATVAIASAPGAARATSPDDVANVTALLEAMRGTGAVPCAFALSTIEGNGNWGGWYSARFERSDSNVAKLRRWLSDGPTDPAVIPILRNAMAPGDPCVRQTAARLLGRTRHARAIVSLSEAIRDADPSTRELAAFGLGMTDSPAAFDPLAGALRDAEPSVRAAAATSLGQTDDDRAKGVLVPVLKNDRVPAVRQAAAFALGALD